MKNLLITILFVLSVGGALYTAYDQLNERNKATKAKIELLHYINRYNTTNSMAVQSAMQDSINYTLVNYLMDNYNK